MTASEIIAAVKTELQQQTGDSGVLSDAALLDLVNEGYTDFCRYTQARLKVGTSTLTALDRGTNFPSDMIEAKQVRWSYNKQLTPKTERELDYRNSPWRDETATTPLEFVVWNYDFMRLRPFSTSAGTVTFKYTYIPSSLQTTDTPSIPDVYHLTLAYFVLAECFLLSRDFANASDYWDRYTQERLNAKKQAREFQKTPNTMFSQKTVDNFNWERVDRGRWYR